MVKHTQTIPRQQAMFDHFVGLELKGSNTGLQKRAPTVHTSIFSLGTCFFVYLDEIAMYVLQKSYKSS